MGGVDERERLMSPPAPARARPDPGGGGGNISSGGSSPIGGASAGRSGGGRRGGSPPMKERSRNARAQARHRAKRKAYIEQVRSTASILRICWFVPFASFAFVWCVGYVGSLAVGSRESLTR